MMNNRRIFWEVTKNPAYAFILPNLEQYFADFRHFMSSKSAKIEFTVFIETDPPPPFMCPIKSHPQFLQQRWTETMFSHNSHDILTSFCSFFSSVRPFLSFSVVVTSETAKANAFDQAKHKASDQAKGEQRHQHNEPSVQSEATI
ncbi:hypothetical protein niasHT_022422 [Heterodera trifolii]|uniref:Uncharacterized protein n=1 Tax=Heterodera trifolii TaxID=157864 RepID=A0ABD2KLT0_9BILA